MCELTHGMLCVNRPLYIYVHLLGSLLQLITMGLHERGWQGMDCIYLAHNRDRWWAVVNMVMSLWFCKRKEFLDWPRKYLLPTTDSAPWSCRVVWLVG